MIGGSEIVPNCLLEYVSLVFYCEWIVVVNSISSKWNVIWGILMFEENKLPKSLIKAEVRRICNLYLPFLVILLLASIGEWNKTEREAIFNMRDL